MSTPHINAEIGDFADVVLMPGDPKRATWIAENFLHDVKLVNQVRGALGYTGYTKNGYRISVMTSGMGLPSMAIYSHELFYDFDVKAIIRIGTMGVYQPEIKLRDVVIAMGASTDNSLYNIIGNLSAVADFDVTACLAKATSDHHLRCHIGNILSSNVFYDYDPNSWRSWAQAGVLGVEMESYALFATAAATKKFAGCICTATDHFETGERLSADERETGLVNMVEIALEACETLISRKGWKKD